MEKRVISTQLQEEDYKIESSLRPQRLEDYIGQEKIKSNMKVYIEAAKARQESLDHVPVSYTHSPSPRDPKTSRMPSSA